MERSDELLESAGLGPDAAQTPKTQTIKGFTCDICCEDEPGLETYALKCGHRYCVACYRQYLSQKIKEEGEAARIQCPTSGCNRIVDSKSLDLLVASELRTRLVYSCVGPSHFTNTQSLVTKSCLPEHTLMIKRT